MSSSWVVEVENAEPQAKVERWVVDMEKKLKDAEPQAKVLRWPKHCIFLVPLRFKINKMFHDSVYKPQTVSLGPFHHHDEELKPMEEHKLRAVSHLLNRDSCKTTLPMLVAAVEEVADELQDAYMELGDEWRGKENWGKFLEMMITDGCFLLEVMRAAVGGKGSIPKDYTHGDPVFSWHGIQHIKPFVQRDMLMVENQLPLRLLEKILAVESGTPPCAASINSMVLKFLEGKDTPEGTDLLGLHPLDIYRTSLLKGPQKHLDSGKGDVEMTMPVADDAVVRLRRVVPRSAWKLSHAGIRFVPNKTSCLDDIYLDNNGRLQMPRVQLDDSTAYRFLNIMAFEATHVGTGNEVTAYVRFVKDLVDSTGDVRLLARKRILEHNLATDAVVWLFNSLARDTSPPAVGSSLWRVRRTMEYAYRRNRYRKNRVRVFVYESCAYLRNKYFRSPWTLLALVAATLLLVGGIVQSVYAVLSYYQPDKGDPKMH